MDAEEHIQIICRAGLMIRPRKLRSEFGQGNLDCRNRSGVRRGLPRESVHSQPAGPRLQPEQHALLQIAFLIFKGSKQAQEQHRGVAQQYRIENSNVSDQDESRWVKRLPTVTHRELACTYRFSRKQAGLKSEPPCLSSTGLMNSIVSSRVLARAVSLPKKRRVETPRYLKGASSLLPLML